MKKTASLSALFIATAGQAMAAGYKIPETSINSTALSAAYVANAHGADAAYYNPAAMVHNDEGAALEADLTYIHLTSIDYTGLAPADSSEKEHFFIPSFHYSSPAVGQARFGLSVVTPAGLTKRWLGTGRAAAEKFGLKTVEINPSAAYRLSDRLSLGAGARMIYSKGEVRSDNGLGGTRVLNGDSFDFGYNLALHFQPTAELALAATYRSKVDLTVEGDAILAGGAYSGGTTVAVPVPAALSLAAAYTFNGATTVELVYEKTYWSAYDQLDFNYDVSFVAPNGLSPFDAPLPKQWKDSDTFRIGLTHKLDSKWTLMAGFAYDKTPVNKQYLGFELPDSNAKMYSLGARYQYSDQLSVGAGFLYDQKDTVNITAADANSLGTATFDNAAAYLLTVGAEYKF